MVRSEATIDDELATYLYIIIITITDDNSD